MPTTRQYIKSQNSQNPTARCMHAKGGWACDVLRSTSCTMVNEYWWFVGWFGLSAKY